MHSRLDGRCYELLIINIALAGVGVLGRTLICIGGVDDACVSQV